MLPLNQCSNCLEDFASLRAFDDHILSKPSDPIFDCMSTKEMLKQQWKQNEHNRWSSPGALADAAGMRERMAKRSTADATEGTEAEA